MSEQRTWFIKGCNKGTGHVLAKVIQAAGNRVAMMARAKHNEGDLLTRYPETAFSHQLDLTCQSDIPQKDTTVGTVTARGIEPPDPRQPDRADLGRHTRLGNAQVQPPAARRENPDGSRNQRSSPTASDTSADRSLTRWRRFADSGKRPLTESAPTSRRHMGSHGPCLRIHFRTGKRPDSENRCDTWTFGHLLRPRRRGPRRTSPIKCPWAARARPSNLSTSLGKTLVKPESVIPLPWE